MVSTIVALVLATIFAAVYLFILEDADKLYLWIGLGVITGFILHSSSPYGLRKNSSKVQRLETEEEVFNGDPPFFLMRAKANLSDGW